MADHVGTEKCAWATAEMKGMNNELKLFAGLRKRCFQYRFSEDFIEQSVFRNNALLLPSWPPKSALAKKV